MSDFIIAKSGEHFTYNSFGCSVPFYTETISLEHLHSLAFLSLLETVPFLLRPVFSSLLCGFLSLFLSLDYWYSIFMLSWTVSSNHHLHSMISKFVPFCLAFLPGFMCLHQYLTGLSTSTGLSALYLLLHVSPQCRMLPSAQARGLRTALTLCFLYCPCSVSHQNLMVAPPKCIPFHCPHCYYFT